MYCPKWQTCMAGMAAAPHSSMPLSSRRLLRYPITSKVRQTGKLAALSKSRPDRARREGPVVSLCLAARRCPASTAASAIRSRGPARAAGPRAHTRGARLRTTTNGASAAAHGSCIAGSVTNWGGVCAGQCAWARQLTLLAPWNFGDPRPIRTDNLPP